MNDLKRFALAATAAALFLGAGGEAAARADRLCPMIYRPVCAMTRNAHHQTFKNRCEAENADAIVQHEGVCRRPRH